jgi:hypothetical protein
MKSPKRARKPLKITPKGNSGYSEVSEKHDLYLTGILPKKQKNSRAATAPARSR